MHLLHPLLKCLTVDKRRMETIYRAQLLQIPQKIKGKGPNRKFISACVSSKVEHDISPNWIICKKFWWLLGIHFTQYVWHHFPHMTAPLSSHKKVLINQFFMSSFLSGFWWSGGSLKMMSLKSFKGNFNVLGILLTKGRCYKRRL